MAISEISMEGFHQTNNPICMSKISQRDTFLLCVCGMVMPVAESTFCVFASSEYNTRILWQIELVSNLNRLELNIQSMDMIEIILAFIIDLHLACLGGFSCVYLPGSYYLFQPINYRHEPLEAHQTIEWPSFTTRR